MRVARVLIAATAVAAGVSLILASPAGAQTTKAEPTTTVLTTAVGDPFNFEVRDGNVLVINSGLGSSAR